MGMNWAGAAGTGGTEQGLRRRGGTKGGGRRGSTEAAAAGKLRCGGVGLQAGEGPRGDSRVYRPGEGM